MSARSLKRRYWLGVLYCAALLGAAAWFQFGMGLEPCPLCITQRVLVLLAGIVFLVGALHARVVYAIIAIIVSLAGALVALRHVWLQHLPEDEVPACGPGLAYVFRHFPLTETLRVLLSGTGECSQIVWTFLGLSLPAWTMIAFLMMTGWSFGIFWRHARQKSYTVN